MTIVAGIVLAYLLIVVASCRVFKAVHNRDEQIEEMMRQDFVSARLSLRKTGTHV